MRAVPGLSRRDFLKVGSTVTQALALTRLVPGLRAHGMRLPAGRPNVVILVFDAMSAANLSLHGYARNTTPNLGRFAQRATVFNAHYSTANFTTPGTASLLTGLHPWTHRAINEYGLIARDAVPHNLFAAAGGAYHRLGFCQNLLGCFFLGQFRDDIEDVLSPNAFGFVDPVAGDMLGPDRVDGYRAFDDFLFRDGNPPASLLFGVADRIQTAGEAAAAAGTYASGKPLQAVFDGVMATIARLPSPSLAYLHLWPPHAPYRASQDFAGKFSDGWEPVRKPGHKLVDPRTHHSSQALNALRQEYDEYIANVDAEFGRLLDSLQAAGTLDDSYVIVTSDHGELFERGELGHLTPLLYDPVVRIPLLISSPGQSARQDVNAPTSSVDILPTLVQLAGGDIPSWSEGRVLPLLGGTEAPQRSIFMMEAKSNPAFQPISVGSFAMRRGDYKLIYYKGYRQFGGRDRFELYDLRTDPEEMNDISSPAAPIAVNMRSEMLETIGSFLAKAEP